MAYILRGRKCGTVRVNDSGTVTKESKKISGTVTSYPVEQNSKISEHFERNPITGNLSGIIIGGSAVAILEKMAMTGDIVTYTGSFRMDNIVLTDLDFSTDSSNKNGFYFTASYQRVDIVSAQYVPVGETPLMSAQDSGKSKASQTSAKPKQDGLQTTVPEAISSSAYANYINTFNSKPAPSSGPSSRATPTYTGY